MYYFDFVVFDCEMTFLDMNIVHCKNIIFWWGVFRRFVAINITIYIKSILNMTGEGFNCSTNYEFSFSLQPPLRSSDRTGRRRIGAVVCLRRNAGKQVQMKATLCLVLEILFYTRTLHNKTLAYHHLNACYQTGTTVRKDGVHSGPI